MIQLYGNRSLKTKGVPTVINDKVSLKWNTNDKKYSWQNIR